MEPKKKYLTGYNQVSESRFLSSFSQSKQEQSGEPTQKKPKLDIGKNGNPAKTTNCEIQSTHKKNDLIDDSDDGIWGDEAAWLMDEAIMAQVEHDETVALSQMTQSAQGSASIAMQINKKVVTNEVKMHPESMDKRPAPSDFKNSPRVPLRRIGSSQWPSSTNLSSSHTNNVMMGGKVLTNGTILHIDLEQLRLENKRIKEELNKKAGEARILREKINSSEKEKDKIKKEFSSKMDALKVETGQQKDSFLKEIRSLKGQLDVKNMEIETAERRAQISSSVNRIQPDSPNNRPGLSSSRSLQREIGLECEMDRSLTWAKTGLPLKFVRESVIPELLEPSQPEAPVSESVRSSNPRLFSGVFGTEGGITSRSRCSAVRRELLSTHTSVTLCAALLLSPGLVDITSDNAQLVISQVVDKCHQILAELLKQLESAMCSNNRFIERERELLLSGSRQLPLDRDYDLITHRELYTDERGIPARRALELMSLLVEGSKKIFMSIAKESTEILDTVRNIVRLVEKQRRTFMFQGVLAGSVALIKNILKAEVTISIEIQTLMIDILRWVVSARPGSLVVHNILQTLLAAARYPHFVNSLCHNSAEKTYKENPRHSIIQFTPDSCILQILCTLVKAAETPRKQQLTDLLTLWVLSLFCGEQPRPQWLTAVPSATSCQCHSLVCKLCFSLLSEACFTYPLATGDDCQQLEKVLARGVLLMNTLMNEDEHLLAIVDPHSLGRYEHFQHFMADTKIRLGTNTQFLCTQEEVLKQPGNLTNDAHNMQLRMSFNFLEIGENGKKCSNVLDCLDSQ